MERRHYYNTQTAMELNFDNAAPLETATAKQQLFFDLVLAGKNVNLDGKAGTGKSWIVKQVMEVLKNRGKKMVAVAPTGVAANNIGGATIHSTFRITPYGIATLESANWLASEKRKLMKKIDVIFIDEKSMLRPDLLDAIHWTLVKNGVEGGLKNKQVIFTGDLKQLPPILKDNERSVLYQQYDGEEFYHAEIYKSLDVVDVELDEVKRQSDIEFITNLNIIRDGGRSEYFKGFVHQEPHGIILAPHNETVRAYNKKGLEEQPGEELEFTATVSGNAKADEFNLESVIKVKHGCKIMYLANSQNNPLVNGTLGTFISKVGKYFIQVGEVEYALEQVTFTKKEYVWNQEKDKLEMAEIGTITQYPFKLAYALSIHKSQGLTFDELTIDLVRPPFMKGQLYVALSRATGPAGLRIFVGK